MTEKGYFDGLLYNRPPQILTCDSMERLDNTKSSFDDPGYEPIVQILAFRVYPNVSPRTYELRVSGGIWYMHCILCDSLTHLIDDGSIKKKAIVRIVNFYSHEGRTDKVIYIDKLEIIESQHCRTIGHPDDYRFNPNRALEKYLEENKEELEAEMEDRNGDY
jgi:hypothetical protein